MPLVKMTELFAAHEDNSFAVGAFNVSNMEMAWGAIQAAEELSMPLILQIAEGRLKYSPLDLLGPIMIATAKKCKVPVTVNLDHGSTLETIKLALKLGFTSVMFDGSKYPLEENIKRTREVVEMAHAEGAAVEAEIGRVGGAGLTEEDFKNCIANGIKKINIATASCLESYRGSRLESGEIA